MNEHERVEYDQELASLHAMLAENDFNSLWSEGRSMTMGNAIDYALESIGEETMSWIIFLEFLHIVAAMVMIGGGFARQVVGIAKKSDDIHQVAFLTQAAGRIDRLMVIPGSDLVILFGIILGCILKQPILGFIAGRFTQLAAGSQSIGDRHLGGCIYEFVPYNRDWSRSSNRRWLRSRHS